MTWLHQTYIKSFLLVLIFCSFTVSYGQGQGGTEDNMSILGYGARALGLADRIGSIEAGKCADLIALDLGSLNTQPLYDPVAQIAYAASSRQVSHVWIDGVAQLRDYEFCRLDVEELIAKATAWAQKIRD